MKQNWLVCALTLLLGASACSDDKASSVAPPSSLPDSKTLTGKLYDFGPDGTTFDPPATLSLPVETVPASGQTAVVSWLGRAVPPTSSQRKNSL